MAARMEKTRHAGIYKRGGRYVFSYRLNGKQRGGVSAHALRGAAAQGTPRRRRQRTSSEGMPVGSELEAPRRFHAAWATARRLRSLRR